MKIVTLAKLEREPAVSPLFTAGVTRSGMFPTGDFNSGLVHFSAGSRNKFHVHSTDQVLIITDGTGVVATDTEERVVSAGDVVLIPAGENHWHGAAPTRLMTHIAMQLADESGSPVTWGEHVSDEQYANTPDVADPSA